MASSPFAICHISDLFIWPHFLCFPLQCHPLSGCCLVVCLCSVLCSESFYYDITYLRWHTSFWINPSSQYFQGMCYFLPLNPAGAILTKSDLCSESQLRFIRPPSPENYIWANYVHLDPRY